ncbi:cell division protein FtsW [Geodermatophilus telluris]|uniref:Probable peptidoglycan glycosyltransferase FtsW n=1 Tax=Geodermatophilus telluris TaxID=1190417 RepID=A0A1G6S4Y6_9ACTN|nr:putative lipid II flippase FtsW [Geodermatophilus telluris]SDD11970.1 cell division protein FtsW [Geodermatophilus telluris]
MDSRTAPSRGGTRRTTGRAARTGAAGARPRLRGPAWLDGPMTSCHLVIGAAGLLLAIGLVMVFSASAIEAALNDEPAWKPGLDQLVFAALGLVALGVAVRLPTGLLRRWSPIALVVVTLLLVAVLVPGVGVAYNGSRAWISLGFTDFQPSELSKLVVALWGAHVLALRGRSLTVRTLLVPLVPVFLLLSVLLIREPDFGAVVSLLLVVGGLLWAGGAPWRVWAIAFASAVTAVVLLVMAAPYRLERITAFMDPFADPTDTGFQAIRGFYALATGGLWGVGLGNSAMKWNLLPEAESDYIFAIIGEELGFLGCLVVVTLYAVLAYAGFRIARRAADRFVSLASVAITVWLVGQAAMNMGYVVGLLPVTGVTLPLVSAGGTSLVLTLFIVGILIRFARSEPEAIEHARRTERGRLARWLLPVPEHAVDPVRPRRSRPGRPERRDGAPAARAGASPRRPVDAHPVRRPAEAPRPDRSDRRAVPPPARRPDRDRVPARPADRPGRSR